MLSTEKSDTTLHKVYIEIYKTLIREIKEHLSGETLYVHESKDQLMLALPKLVYRLKMI